MRQGSASLGILGRWTNLGTRAKTDCLSPEDTWRIRELANSAMLLSQGAHRAIEMRPDADGATLDVSATRLG
jgi:hypothetical protein